MNVRLGSYTVNGAGTVDTGAEKIGNAIQSFGKSIGRGIQDLGDKKETEKLLEVKAIQDADKAEAKKQAAELKAAEEQQKAIDDIRAADALGKIQREYVRQSEDFNKTFIGSRTGKEYEEGKRNIFNTLIENAAPNLSKEAQVSLKKSGTNWLNSQLLSDLEKAYKEEAEAANVAAQSVAKDALISGASLGESGDLFGAKVAFGMTREALKNFADKMAENSELPMREFDANYMLSFLTGAAKSDNPELAWEMSKPENLADFMNRDYEKDKEYFDTLSVNLRKHLEKPLEYGRNRIKLEVQQEINNAKINETMDFLNNPIIMGADLETVRQKNKFGDVSTFKDMYDISKGKYDEDNSKFAEIYEKEKNQTLKTDELSFEELRAYNDWKKNGGGKGLTDMINDLGIAEDAAGIAFGKVDKLISAGVPEDEALETVYKEFSTGRIKVDATSEDFKNVRFIDTLKNITPEEAQEYINKGVSVRDIIKAQAEKLYDNSGKVGDGSISNADLQYVMKQVLGMTVDENGNVDNNILKAFYARNYLQDHNASQSQIDTFNKTIYKALTDKNFKANIAKLANRPSFDSMFAKTNGTSKVGGVAGFFRSRQDDMDAYVDNMGKTALLGAMAYLNNGDVDSALQFYDEKVREAYDYVKSDIIDTTMVNKVLSEGRKPIVYVNGQMSEIVGRDNNGEYILRNTGRKVNGDF